MLRSARADAIVGLGCPGMARLTRRVERAVGLFRHELASLLVMSGGGGGATAEAEIMRDVAISRGVPEAAVLAEARSRDTLGNARETSALLRERGLRSVILVSDAAHLPRAALLFRLAGVDVAGCSGVRASSPALALATALREVAAFPVSLLCALAAARISRPR